MVVIWLKKIQHTEESHRDFLSSIVKAASNSIFLCPTTPHEIIDLVSILKLTKHLDMMMFHQKIVKSAIHEITEPMSIAINVSIKK